MNNLLLPDLTVNEIDVLLEECEEEINHLKAKLALIIIERDEIRKKLIQWKNEKDMLEIMKAGFGTSPILNTNNDTIRTLQKRYERMSRRLTDIFNENTTNDKEGLE